MPLVENGVRMLMLMLDTRSCEEPARDWGYDCRAVFYEQCLLVLASVQDKPLILDLALGQGLQVGLGEGPCMGVRTSCTGCGQGHESSSRVWTGARRG